MVSEACPTIGMLSEEAQEAANEVYRYNRQHHARKFNRVATNAGVFNIMLALSDPLVTISTQRLTPVDPACTNAEVRALLTGSGVTPTP